MVKLTELKRNEIYVKPHSLLNQPKKIKVNRLRINTGSEYIIRLKLRRTSADLYELTKRYSGFFRISSYSPTVLYSVCTTVNWTIVKLFAFHEGILTTTTI
jgi:hypothetical protein